MACQNLDVFAIEMMITVVSERTSNGHGNNSITNRETVDQAVLRAVASYAVPIEEQPTSAGGNDVKQTFFVQRQND